MNELIFPPFEYRVKDVNGKKSIFDIIRKKYIVLTPEEVVRQHLVNYLINIKKYPRSLISVEDGMKVNRMIKRSDVVVYGKTGEVFLAAECKSAKIKLTQKSMDQLSVYNQHYKANYLALTNGLAFFVCKIDYETKKATFIDNFPDFK
jgi:hypothetical protein